jgi:hypothetical protein
MQAISIQERVERKKNPLNLALITEIEESSTIVDVVEIIASQNINDLCKLEIPHDIIIFKNIR